MVIYACTGPRSKHYVVIDRGGVYSPGAAFARTTLIDRLNRHGLVFSVKRFWREGLEKKDSCLCPIPNPTPRTCLAAKFWCISCIWVAVAFLLYLRGFDLDSSFVSNIAIGNIFTLPCGGLGSIFTILLIPIQSFQIYRKCHGLQVNRVLSDTLTPCHALP